MEMLQAPMKMNLITFVKLIPKYKKVKIVCNQDTEELDIKALAEHQYDKVSGIDYLCDYFLITVIPAPTIAEPSPYIAPCV